MSLSSLPDIFKRSLTLQVRTGKQGPSFALHLNPSSPEKYLPSRAGYAPGENNYASMGSGRARAMSTQQAKQKQAVLRDFNVKPRDDVRGKMRVSFKGEGQLAASAPLREKLGVSVSNWSHFPYESSRRFNNNTLSLEESDSLSSKLEVLCKEGSALQATLSSTRQEGHICRSRLLDLGQTINQQLDEFTVNFSQSLRQCYASLSALRRETNEETKANKTELQKLKGDMQTCAIFSSDLRTLTSNRFAEYVRTGEQAEEEWKGNQLLFDFQEISSIRKSSRGATGDMSRRVNRAQMQRNIVEPRRSHDLRHESARDNRFVLNGREIELLNFQDD